MAISVLRIKEESTTKHPRENFLNLKEDLEEKRDTELTAERNSSENGFNGKKREPQKQLFADFLENRSS